MLTTLAERIDAAIARSSYKDAASLAADLKMSKSWITDVKKGRYKGNDKLTEMAGKLNVRIDWLINGSVSNAPDWALPSPDELVAAVKTASHTDQKRIAEALGQDRSMAVKIIGTVSAGPGLIWDDQASDERVLPTGSTAVRVVGESGGNVIRDGQLAILAPEKRKPTRGDIVAVQRRDGRAYIKRFHFDSEVALYILQSLSADHDPVVIPPAELHTIRVVIGAWYE